MEYALILKWDISKGMIYKFDSLSLSRNIDQKSCGILFGAHSVGQFLFVSVFQWEVCCWWLGCQIGSTRSYHRVPISSYLPSLCISVWVYHRDCHTLLEYQPLGFSLQISTYGIQQYGSFRGIYCTMQIKSLPKTAESAVPSLNSICNELGNCLRCSSQATWNPYSA